MTLRVIANEIATFNFNDIELIVRDFLFGCGHYNNLKFSDGNFMGIIGFDQVPLSLILQIGNRFGGRRFSQCLVSFLVDHNIAGKINFGVEIEVPEYEGVVTSDNSFSLQRNSPLLCHSERHKCWK